MSEFVGHTLGPYRILEQLGQGGMATVYKAYQPSMDRYVAIKVLPHHFAQDPTFLGRFEQEAKVIARLEHARILPVYDYGEQDGITYIVMRYLDAGTLADRLHEGPLSLEEIARIISQIAEGLDYAHKRGVIHRDIKPANIMLDASNDVYITDFGISKLVEGTAQFTGSGIVGTPAYVSPEQGLGRPIDYRSDIYSLGVVLYQMVIGDVPYHAETPMAVVIKHIYEPLPLPRQVKPDVPEAVERVILRAMAKEPEERFQSCGEMAQALQQAVAELTVPSYLAPTQVSTDTEPYLTTPAAAPVRPAAPPTARTPMPEVADAGTVPMAAAGVEAETRPAAAPAPKKRSRALPVAIIGGLLAVALIVLLGVLVIAPALSRGEERPPVTGAGEAQPTPPSEQQPPPPGEEQPPAGGGEQPLEEVPTMLTCSSDMEPEIALNFNRERLNLPGLDEERRRHFSLRDGMLDITPRQGGEPIVLALGPDVMDSSIGAMVLLPDPESTVILGSRYQSNESYYAVAARADGWIVIYRGGEREVAAGQGPSLGDGSPHLIVLRTVGNHVEAQADGQTVVAFDDSEGLPPARFMFGARGSHVGIDALLVCTPPGAGEAPAQPIPPAGPRTLFGDNFDGELSSEWAWINEPPAFEIGGGVLTIPIPPNLSAFPPRADAPMLVVPVPDQPTFSVQVDVTITPTQNFQEAGLVLLDRNRRPAFMLWRAFCDADVCRGDAVYFDSLPASDENPDAYRAAVAGSGEMPRGEPITLRLVLDQGRLMAFYKRIGGEWQSVGEWALGGVQPGFIGIVVASGAPVEPIPATFDNFVILDEGAP